MCLFVMDGAAKRMYNQDKDVFIRQLATAFEDAGITSGGAFLADYEALGRRFGALSLFDYPAITDSAHNSPEWYKGIKE